MTTSGWLQILAVLGISLALTRPLGGYLARLFSGERTWLSWAVRPIERLALRLGGTDPHEEQTWPVYAASMLAFSLVGVLLLYALQRLQQMLPLNPQHLPAVAPDLAFNTAASFVSNTNWQAYAGESTMSYALQTLGLTVQNFLSAGTGIALSMALIRGLSRRSARTLGNFWVDLVRSVVGVLLPLSLVFAVVLVWQGVPQNLHAYVTASTLEGGTQVLPQGLVASQEAIKMLGTNGGGVFNANSAHPYENPTPLTNLLSIVAIFSIGAALTNTFGRMVGNERQGWALLSAMCVLFLAGAAVAYRAESAGNPAFASLGVDQALSAGQSGGNMEGKEVRFGVAGSTLFSVVTTDASCGAVNSMLSSYTPIGGAVPLFNILLGEIIVGGVGSGLMGMLVFAIISVFVVGLMVGRTPEYIGKRIESREIKMAVIAVILIVPLTILGFSAVASVTREGSQAALNGGPHGFTEILYAFSSGAGNNGSAFAGLSANSGFYNIALAVAMLAGRFLWAIPVLAIAGSLAAKNRVPASAGTFPTTGPLFVGVLVGVIVIVGGLIFFPSLALGPLAEHLLMRAGMLF